MIVREGESGDESHGSETTVSNATKLHFRIQELGCLAVRRSIRSRMKEVE